MELKDAHSPSPAVAGLPTEPLRAGSGDPPTTQELKDAHSPSLNDSSRPPMPCCVRLACKSMTYRPDERPGLLHFSDTQLYWCNVTLDPLGPDAHAANPNHCQPGRACFRVEE